GSGWALCLLPIAFGTLFLWAAWRWMDRLFGRGAGLLALALLALMPQLVLLTAELRGYSLLLCLAAASLAALERGLQESSPRWIAIAAALAALMMLTHYAAVRVVGAMFLYGALRIAAARGPSRVARAWGFGQALLGGMFLLQYRWQVSHLRGGTLEYEAQSDWLKASYFRPGEEGLLAFLARQTAAVFDFLFLTRGAAVPAFLLAPFLIAAAGGVLRIYPYSGSRHSIDLALFAAAAIAFALSRLSGPRLWPALLLAAALLPGALAVVW
ncbi:MAG TPA: glycosyltransferase family 39 protein, partial [Thermoanaerobaculia bacterium]